MLDAVLFRRLGGGLAVDLLLRLGGIAAVFLVGENEQLTMTPVTVGLRDFANAEILSGVKAGDIVSTGTVETK